MAGYPVDMSAPAPQLPSPATLEDLLALPEDIRRRYELMGGELVERGAATARHGGAQGQAFHLLSPYNRRAGGPPGRPGGWIFATETDIYFDAENTLRPDVAGWRRERLAELPAEFPVRILPDWTCEVLSTNKSNDLIRKKRIYHRHQVPHYWILDPTEQNMLANRWGPDGYIEVRAAQRGERVRAEPFEAIELQVGVFFGEDEDL
jgi:Uma2 family endonuclease